MGGRARDGTRRGAFWGFENSLDDKSNGFQLEASLNRSAQALERLCLVLAIATLYQVSQETQVAEAGKRRLMTHLALSPNPDPEPAMASQKQHLERSQPRFIPQFRKAAKPHSRLVSQPGSAPLRCVPLPTAASTDP